MDHFASVHFTKNVFGFPTVYTHRNDDRDGNESNVKKQKVLKS